MILYLDSPLNKDLCFIFSSLRCNSNFFCPYSSLDKGPIFSHGTPFFNIISFYTVTICTIVCLNQNVLFIPVNIFNATSNYAFQPISVI